MKVAPDDTRTVVEVQMPTQCPRCGQLMRLRLFWDTRNKFEYCSSCSIGVGSASSTLELSIPCPVCSRGGELQCNALRLTPLCEFRLFFHCLMCNRYWTKSSEALKQISRADFLSILQEYRQPGDPDLDTTLFF